MAAACQTATTINQILSHYRNSLVNAELVQCLSFRCLNPQLQLSRILAVKQIAIFVLLREPTADNDFEYWFLIEGVTTNIAVLTSNHADIFAANCSGEGEVQALEPIDHGLRCQSPLSPVVSPRVRK